MAVERAGDHQEYGDQTQIQLICRQLRVGCEDLLLLHGVRQGMHPLRIVVHTFMNFMNAEAIEIYSREMFPIGNTTSVPGVITERDGTAREALVTTATLMPIRRAGNIRFMIATLGEHIVLEKDGAWIRREGYDRDFGDPLNPFDVEGFKRRLQRPSFSDAQEWEHRFRTFEPQLRT